ncbi:MAG TPA: sialidase family protein [Patescibacteria group bacterium]|nr:sialidase family protein [Patescibacteria group bacterium]
MVLSRSRVLVVIGALALLGAAMPVAAVSTDTFIDFGSNKHLFSQNRENEPFVAIDPAHPNILAAGVNDNPDGEACNAGDPTTCPYTDGVGGAGISFSTDGGATWTAPTYTGISARNCLGPAECVADPTGPISTLPWYDEYGMFSIGDPALAFGPKPDAHGNFSWQNGSRLYYADIALPLPGGAGFKGWSAIAVSRTDDVAGAMAGTKSAWMAPVIASKQNAAVINDKNQLWVDNAASSPFFGNVYECNVGFRGSFNGGSIPEPVLFARSTDGGDSWSTRQLSAATNNSQTGGRQACMIRTTSDGVVVVIWSGRSDTVITKTSPIYETRSFDGGVRFEKPRVIGTMAGIGQVDPIQGTFSIDGVAGARTNTFPAMDIANGAPTGAGATNRIVVAWSDDHNGTNQEQGWLITSTDKGGTFGSPLGFGRTGDRVNQPAVAISPDGANVYVVYNAYLDPWRSTMADPRRMLGVVRQASWGSLGTWTTLHIGTTADTRGATAQTLPAGFLGDYNSVWATNSGVFGAWNDVRDTTRCPADEAWRQSFLDGSPIAHPAPQNDCPDTFGASSIYGGWYTP